VYDRLSKFTEGAKMVLVFAQDEATRCNHDHIGTEHLLLGLLGEHEGIAAQALTNLGVELRTVRQAVEFVVGRGERAVAGDVPLTPRAKRVIEFSIEEQHRLGHTYHLGTGHLLLGLVREGEGIAAGLLESLGVNLDQLRAQVEQLLSQPPTEGDGGEVRKRTRAAPRPTGGAIAAPRFPPPLTIVRQWRPRPPPTDDTGAAAGDVG